MFKKEAILNTFRPLADGGYLVRFDTNELKPEEVGELANLRNKFGWLIFTGNESKPGDNEFDGLPIPEPDGTKGGRKSQSERLRAVLFRLWEKSGSAITSEAFYERKMEELITYIKGKLN